MGIKTKHPMLLNSLDQMAQTPYLAAYRDHIRAAELVIVEQEQRINELEEALNGTQKDRHACS